MAEEKFHLEGMEKLVERIAETYCGDVGINFIDAANLPVRGRIIETLQLLLELLFPGYTGLRTVTKANLKFVIEDILSQVYSDLSEQVERAFRHRCRMEKCDSSDCRDMSQQVTENLLNELPAVRE